MNSLIDDIMEALGMNEKKRLKQAIRAVEANNLKLSNALYEAGNKIEVMDQFIQDLMTVHSDLMLDITAVAYKLEQSKSANYHKIAAEIRTVLDCY